MDIGENNHRPIRDFAEKNAERNGELSMFRKPMMAAVTAISALAATGAAADTFQLFGEVEGWKIFVDNEKQSCLIEKIDDAENVVQMGLTEDKSVAYLGVFTKGDTNVKKGSNEPVAILIGENLYLGDATGMRGNITAGYSGAYVLSDNPQFATDVAQQYTATVFPEKEYAFVINLEGTKKAIEMARDCYSKL
jgi:hypothetical protein